MTLVIFTVSHSEIIYLVPQSSIITPFSTHMPCLLSILRQDILDHTKVGTSVSKVMVFLPTARQVQIAYTLFSAIKGLPPCFELHSRKSQAARTTASDAFRKSTHGILFASDVAARGVDFPGCVVFILFTGYRSQLFLELHW
jgi:ATP-dependent RNA helicase MSS116